MTEAVTSAVILAWFTIVGIIWEAVGKAYGEDRES